MATHKLPDGTIIFTNYVFPPIPSRGWDWSAVPNDYEPGTAIGWGSTEAEAIADLLSQIEDEAADMRREERGR